MDDFGGSIATAGNTLVIGAPRKRKGGGVVYVFERANAHELFRGIEPADHRRMSVTLIT